MQKQLTVTLMCGLARSGKSTWIKKHKGNDVVVSPDKIRKEIFGHQFYQNAEDFIWAFSLAMAKLLLEQNKSIIIDATNTTSWSRQKWIDIAHQYKAIVKIIYIKTSFEICKKRNKTCSKEERVPLEILKNMDLMFEEPNHYLDEEGIIVKYIKLKK